MPTDLRGLGSALKGSGLRASESSGAPLQEGMEKARCWKATASPPSRRNMSTLESAARPSPMCSLDLW